MLCGYDNGYLVEYTFSGDICNLVIKEIVEQVQEVKVGSSFSVEVINFFVCINFEKYLRIRILVN